MKNPVSKPIRWRTYKQESSTEKISV